MEKTTMYLPPDLRRALADHATRTRQSQAEIIRAALAAYVMKEPRPKLRSVGAGEDAVVTGATSADYFRARLRDR